ncbi:ABC transporter ATP-binding protein [Candidatus Saccharibacteria bacterium]|nr:ABC transporter ATP-binding protein [Candidatus Saccharibacteria bacterium]
MAKRDKENILFARETFRYYMSHVKKYKLAYLFIVFSVPFAGLLLNTLLPYYLSRAIGSLSGFDTETKAMLTYAGIVIVAGFLFNLTGMRAIVKYEALINRDIANDIATRLINKDYAFFSNQKVGALTAKFNDLLGGFQQLEDLVILKTLRTIIPLVVGAGLVAVQSPTLAGILLLLVAIILVQIRIGIRIRKPYRKERKQMRSMITGEVADSITNSLVVKTFANERSEITHLGKRTERLKDLWTKDISIAVTEGALRLLITSVVQMAAIVVAIWQVQNSVIDVGAAIFALAYLQRVSAQVFQLGEIVNGYEQIFLNAAPMTQILLQQNEINDMPGAKTLTTYNSEVSFSNVSYTYADAKSSKDTAIEDFNITFEGGKKYGVVGHSGSGKTTLTRLLLRFDDVTRGSIEVDGQDIRTVSQASLRRAIAYVPQEPMLFHRSLAENIGYANPKATKIEIEKAAKMAHAHEFIQKLPKGYDTIVGERGVKLSGGQRQRVAIARAILKDAPILVLDEATSALDSQSEKLIQDALAKLMKGRTVIVVAHRLSTIQKMDKIIVLESGKIIEQGSHKQLLESDGTYATLWKHQSGGFINE